MMGELAAALVVEIEWELGGVGIVEGVVVAAAAVAADVVAAAVDSVETSPRTRGSSFDERTPPERWTVEVLL